MPFNQNEFRQKLKKGGARPSLFRIVIKGSGDVAANFPVEQFSFMCKAASMPASTLGVIPVGYFGKKIKLAGDRDFENWECSIINDETFDLRNAFEKWNSAINSINGEANAQRNSGATSSPMSYVTDIEVQQYGKEGDIIKKYTLHNAFPFNVGAIELNWDSENAIEEFGVSWSYDYFTTPNL